MVVPQPLAFAAHPDGDATGCLVVSVVSHGHLALVQSLLNDMAQFSAATVGRVVLTLNLPEADPQAPPGGWPLVLQIVRNGHPLG